MEKITPQELYAIYRDYSTVCTDTRKITDNCLFFALKGESFDGNTFAEKALQAGAAYAIVDDPLVAKKSQKCLWVDNVLESLQQLAKHHREQLNIPVIGLTGSNGKTTTKELIYSVLSQKYKVSFTQGNLNNHIGVPLTLLQIRPEHQLAIVEMGANHQKEIAFLSSLCQPDWGYITNFGKAHLEGFGGVEGVIKGKSELYDYLRENRKKAVVNAQDPLQVQKSEGIERVFFGTDKDIQVTLLAAKSGHLSLQWNDREVNTQLTGNYNFTNACAAIAFGKIFEVPQENICVGLEGYTPENNRSQIVRTANQTLIMDAYNANPTSMEAALRNFATFSGKKLAVLGDMLELGEESTQEHQAIYTLTQELEIDEVVLVGTIFAANFGTNANVFVDVAQAKAPFDAIKKDFDVILVKGSRGIRLEKLF